MALESRIKLTADNFSPQSDLIEVFSKKAGVVGVINPSQIASPSGVAGAIQFSDGSAFASDASNLFWDNTNKRLGVGTNAPTNNLSVIDSTSGSSSGIRGITVGNSNTANALNIGSFFNQGIITVQNGPLIIETFGSSKGVSISTGYLVPSAMTHIQGSGSTSATTSLLVQNSSASELFKIRDDGAVGIGGAIYGGWKLSVQGDIKANRIDLYGSTGGGHAMAKIDDNGTLMRNNTFAIDGGTGNAGQQANLAVGEYFSTLARLYVKGSGQTAATTSLLVQNSIGTNTLRVYDDRVVEVPYRIHTPFIRNENANLVLYSGSYEIEIQSSNPTNSSGSLRTTGDITTTDNQTKNVINVNNLVSSTSASFNTLNGFAFTSTITQTIGTIRGLFINPTLNASTDFKAIQSTSGGAYINTSTPNASAILQADSTTQGFLPPRMTTAQKNAIATPAIGLMVFDTTLGRPCFYNGAWVTL